MLNKIKIQNRLMIGFGVLLLLLISLTLFGLQNLRSLSTEINHLNDVAVAKLHWINKMSDAVRFRGTSIRDVALKQDIAFMKTEVQTMREANEEYQTAFTTLQSLIVNNADEQALLVEIQDFEQKLAKIIDEVLEHSLNEDLDAAVEVISDQLRPVQGELIELIVLLSEQIKQQIAQSAESANQSYNTSLVLSGLLMLFSLVLGIILSFLITKSITKPLNKIRDALHNIETRGDYSLRVEVTGRDETAQTAKSLNQFLSQLQVAFDEVNLSLDAVARGEFDKQLNLALSGDLAKLQQGVNASISSVSTTMTGLTEVMDNLYAGNFTVRMSDQVQGDFKTKVDQAVESIHDVIMSINAIMDGMAQGRFDQRLPNEAKGELASLVNNINESLETISLAINQTVDLSQSLAAGDLTRRIEADFNGDLGTMKNALNTAASQLGDTLQAILNESERVDHASATISEGNIDLN
jgi:methyl-accepting chemotaxis protein